jgi:hypothetical protein
MEQPHGVSRALICSNVNSKIGESQRGTVLYTEGWVCDVALIEYTLGNPRRAGILEGRVQGANGGQRELVYEQPGTEVDDSCHSWRVPSK